MSQPSHPISELSPEEFMGKYAITPSLVRKELEGYPYFRGSFVAPGSVVATKQGTRVVIWCGKLEVVFVIGEKMFRQDIIGFSKDHYIGGIIDGTQKAKGMATFAMIVVELIQAGFAVTGTAAKLLYIAMQLGEGAMDVRKEGKMGLLLKFISTFLALRLALEPIAKTLYDKLFNALVKSVLANLGEALDPEGVCKIFIGILAWRIKKKLDIKVKGGVVIVVAIIQAIFQVLKAVPSALRLTERQTVETAWGIVKELRRMGVSVSEKEMLVIAIEMRNPIVIEHLYKLKQAAEEYVKS